MLLTFQLAYKYYKFSGGGVGGCKGDFNIELQSVSWLWLELDIIQTGDSKPLIQ